MIFVIGLVSYIVARSAIAGFGSGGHVANAVDNIFIPIGITGMALMIGSVCYKIIQLGILP